MITWACVPVWLSWLSPVVFHHPWTLKNSSPVAQFFIPYTHYVMRTMWAAGIKESVISFMSISDSMKITQKGPIRFYYNKSGKFWHQSCWNSRTGSARCALWSGISWWKWAWGTFQNPSYHCVAPLHQSNANLSALVHILVENVVIHHLRLLMMVIVMIIMWCATRFPRVVHFIQLWWQLRNYYAVIMSSHYYKSALFIVNV